MLESPIMKRQRYLAILLWTLATLALSYVVDTWLKGAAARLMENTNYVFLDVWVSVLGRLGTGISFLLLYRYLARAERSLGAGIALVLGGLLLMIYPSIVFLLQMRGVIADTPAFFFLANSLTGISASLVTAIGILELVRDPAPEE